MKILKALSIFFTLCGLGLASAVQADPINWEAIAQCESSGNWAANTGNGDYGGLQITESTWQANGGVGLPSQASPQQQIAIAQRIMDTQGPKAWPTCASRGDATAAVAPVGSLTHYLTSLAVGMM